MTSLGEPWGWRCAYCLRPAELVAVNGKNRIGACRAHGDLAMAELVRIRREVERIEEEAAR